MIKFEFVCAPPAPIEEWTQDPQVLTDCGALPAIEIGGEKFEAEPPMGGLTSVGRVGRSLADPSIVEEWVRKHVTPQMIESEVGIVLDRVEVGLPSSWPSGFDLLDFETFRYDREDIESLFWVLKRTLRDSDLVPWVERLEEIDLEVASLRG